MTVPPERGALASHERWIASVRLVAVPFVLVEVAIERGNYPEGSERFAWGLAALFALGAGALFLAERETRSYRAVALAGLLFDSFVVSAYVVLYAFEPGSPVRQLLLLVVVEAALRYGRPGAGWAFASAPALALFEWRAAARLDVPYDVGHVLFPIGLQLLVGLIVGSLVATRRTASGASSTSSPTRSTR